jgi:hypothetical protein
VAETKGTIMLRRFVLALAAAMVAVVLTAIPSYADVYSENCADGYDSMGTYYKYCVWAEWHNWAGPTGITVFQVGAYVTGEGWENGSPPAISGDFILLKNNGGVVKWSKNSGVDVTSTSDPCGPFYLNGPGNGVAMPDTARAWVTYQGYLRRNGAADPGTRTITVVMNS